MERLGGWWRPWHYGDVGAEYAAVRNGVSICDVSTLGKMQVSGPGTLALLEHLYPVPISSLAHGRARYGFMLDERGYVIDDGMVAVESDHRVMEPLYCGGAQLFVYCLYNDTATTEIYSGSLVGSVRC